MEGIWELCVTSEVLLQVLFRQGELLVGVLIILFRYAFKRKFYFTFFTKIPTYIR